MTYLLFIGVVLIALVGCAVVIGTGTATNTVDRKVDLKAEFANDNHLEGKANDSKPDSRPVPSTRVHDGGPTADSDSRRSASAPGRDEARRP